MSLNNDGALTGFDFFAGGGGASLGLKRAGINMLAALNHSPVAIATHAANFPGALHLLADIRKQSEWGLTSSPVDIMWASPDCTHHSIAKGGQSRDAKERALAEELLRFALSLDANSVMIENVSEFTDWGPVIPKLDKDGNHVHKYSKKRKVWEAVWVSDKRRKAEYYNHWVAAMKSMGYVNYQFRLLNSADFGAPQSRVRYFGIFTRKGIAISWPTSSHHQHGKGGLTKWRGVREVLDLSDRGRSIFTEWDKGPGRKEGDRPAPKTLARIIAGVRKHVIDEKCAEPWLDKRTSNHPSGKANSGSHTRNPSPTIATCYLPDLVTPVFVSSPGWYGSSRGGEEPCMTLVAGQDKVPVSMITAKPQQFMAHYFSGGGQHSTLCHPCPPVLCIPKARLITCVPFSLMQYNGGSDAARCLGLDDSCNTVTTENRFGLLSLQFMGQSNGVSRGVNPAAKTWRLDTANRTLTGTPNQCLYTALFQNNGTRARDQAARLTRPLKLPSPTNTTNGGNLSLMTYYGNGGFSPLVRPCPTLRTNDTAALVWARPFTFSHQFSNGARSIERPSRTIVASRRHQYLVQVFRACPQLLPAAEDSPEMVELKMLCAEHGIADIFMRMLKVSELKLIMGFPADYYLGGSATKQKEMLGNAVVPQVAEAIGRAMLPALRAARLRKLPRLRQAEVKRWEQGQLFAALAA